MDALITKKKSTKSKFNCSCICLWLLRRAFLVKNERRHAATLFGTCILAPAPRPLSRPCTTWFCLVMLSAVPFSSSIYSYFLKSISELDVRKCKSRLPNQHNSSPVSFFNWVVQAGSYGRCQEVANNFSWNGARKLDGPPFGLDWDGPWHEVLQCSTHVARPCAATSRRQYIHSSTHQ